MEVQYRARRSFEKPRVEAPPRLQVIGFNVSPKADAAALLGPVEDMEIASRARASYTELTPPPQPKPASSPRSALQQLLHHHSSPSTSPSSSNHCLPPLLPPSTSSPSANQTLITAGSPTSHKPVCSSPPSNQNLTNGLLQPAAANHKWTNGGLLHPSAANQKWSSTGVSRPQSPPASAHESKSSTGHLKSLLQSVSTTSDIPANHSSHASISRSLVQSQCASSPASAGSQMMISKQTINQQNSKALIKENYEAFFQIKQTGADHARNPEAKAHEIKGQYISNNKLTDEFPYAVKSKKSSWLHDEDDQTSAGKCIKSTWKGSNEHPLGNEKSRKCCWSEEKSKKSSLFMFAAPESHHQHHSGEHIIALTDMDFLSSCHLCRRFLGQGQDVFMYSGDKAFCSMECRYQQIVIDERKERCSPAIIRSGASPVYQQISATVSSTHHPVTINKPHFINTAAAA